MAFQKMKIISINFLIKNVNEINNFFNKEWSFFSKHIQLIFTLVHDAKRLDSTHRGPD